MTMDSEQDEESGAGQDRHVGMFVDFVLLYGI
jgi:hypothetical protein